MRRLAWLASLCATILLPLPSVAQVRISALEVGVAGLAAAGPDLVATPGLIDDYVGNHDGIANPLETVRVEFGLWNVGAEDARNVLVTWDIDNPHVRLGSRGRPSSVPVGDTGTVTFDTRISPDATSADVTIVITVTADNGGPWRFIATFAIVAPSIRFAHESTTVSDPVPTGDGDGIAEPGERLFVTLSLRNDGDETATSARVSVAALDPHATPVAGEAVHMEWPAGETRDTNFVIDLDAEFTAPELSLFFQVNADAWGPWQFSHVVAVVTPAPEFVLASAWVFDPPPGGNRDGRAVPGEGIRPRVRLRNVAPADARNVEVTMVVDDPDVTVLRDLVAHDAWPAGEARSNDGLILRIASDATPHDFIATVRVTADGGGGPWQFDVPFTIEAPDIPFGVVRSWVFDPRPGGNRDSTASPGERVLTRVRVKNEGTDDAFAVSVVLTSDDPDVIVVAGEMTYERWPAGAAENNTGFVVDISGDARPHDARVTVTITTAYGVTSQFSVDIPIAYRAVELLRRSSWVFDPEPGGDRDGQAEAGERVRPRLRLLHVGSEQARNVRIALSTDDADITVAQGDLLYESWEPGVAHTATFVLDVAPDAAVHDVTLRAAIRADNGGPWDMSFTLPIAGPAIAFAVQGLTRVSVNAGGSRAPGIRLRHVGVEPVEDVRITLASTDSDISVGKAQVTHSTWLPGETRDSGDVTVRASADALPRAAPVVVSVTTAQGGLWQFEVAIAIERPTVFRLWGSSISDSSPGGNSDGDANPGETVVPTVRIENHSLEAFDVVATLTTDDPDLTIVDGVDTRATWPGLYRRNRIETLSDFAILIADDAAAHEATVTVTIAASHGDPRQHTISFHIRPSLAKLPAFALRNSWPWDPQPGGNRDGQANPGERVFPRVRIANTGGPATGAVQAVLSIIDDDITVVNGIVTHEAWPAGEARNNNGFVLDISETATPHDVAAVLSVTADDAGPWQFAVTIPIVAQEVVATALLANYPNPFNPETWIPFDLSEAAEVTVHVYDARGVVVRRLDLGRLPPGAYRRRGAAAYWDGRNDFGESVSSGMYMYELRAGASRQMRRMVVRK